MGAASQALTSLSPHPIQKCLAHTTPTPTRYIQLPTKLSFRLDATIAGHFADTSPCTLRPQLARST